MEHFRPHPLLSNAHIQTIWPSQFRKRPTIPLIEERLELADGDFLDLAWTTNSSTSLVLFLHGLEGNLESHYAKGLMESLSRAGHRVVFMHFRGCSGVANRLPRGYHSGETDDLRYVVGLLNEREQPERMSALGVSLGGNVLLKYLAEEQTASPFDQAIAVSVPYDLRTCALTLTNGTARIYQNHLLSKLKESGHRKMRVVEMPVTSDELNRIETIYEFDDRITAPLHGFADADDYYARSSSKQFLLDIRTPTTLIHALDDPFMTPACTPTPDHLSDQVNLILTSRGGHVGFVGHQLLRTDYWLDRTLCQLLNG